MFFYKQRQIREAAKHGLFVARPLRGGGGRALPLRKRSFFEALILDGSLLYFVREVLSNMSMQKRRDYLTIQFVHNPRGTDKINRICTFQIFLVIVYLHCTVPVHFT